MRTRRRKLLLPACLLAAALIAASCTDDGSDGGSDANPEGYTPGGDSGPQSNRVTGADGAAIEVRYDLSRPTSVLVDVEAPSGAQEVQLSTDATFGDASWEQVDGEIELPVADTGYVQVFARFRGGDGDTATAPIVAGVVVDPMWSAATRASAESPHQSAAVGLVAPDVLMVRVETGRIVRGGLDAPDTVLGYPVSTDALDNRGGYALASSEDDALDGEKPVEVKRVTRVSGTANVNASPLQIATHDLYLKLPAAVREGATYTVSFPDGVVEPATFSFDPTSSRSFAIHANQVGYKPDDPLKVAYVSAWNGAGITPAGPLSFSVIDAASGSSVLEGTSSERTTSGDGEFGRGDLTGASVQELDFSEVDEAGTYRVCVETLGCSVDFAISDTATWRRVAVAVARAMYHQRSGIELGEPYTSVERPRGFHPEDGITVQQAQLAEIDMSAAETSGGAFEELVATASDETVSEAWGGHFDAGDWDRRISHLGYLRTALDLVELYPETWATLELGIPESGNNIPDLIDEGLWDLDLYRRMQMPDGAIRGGIESDEHPLPGQTSWTQTQEVFAFAPDARSSYSYAGMAAETARVLTQYDAALAAEYQQSALAAMQWAEANPETGDAAESTEETRAMAAAALFRLTGDVQWQDVFVEASPFADGPVELLGCQALRLCDAAWIYARTDQPAILADVKQNALESLRRNAENLADAQDTTKFGWSMEHPQIPLVWGLGPSTPKTMGLLRGHTVTGDQRLCSAAIRSATFSLGANPLDTVFLTGIGQQNVRYPLIVDSFAGGLPVWPGTPVYGLHTLNGTADESWVAEFQLRPAGAFPDPEGLPFLQSYSDVTTVPMMNEFTVHQSHAFALYAFGSLAGLDC